MKKPVLLAMLILGIKLAPAQRAISKEEALNAAHRLETASNNGDVDFLNHFIYVDSLLGRIRQKCESMQDPEFFQGYSSSFTKSFIHYGEKIQASVKQGDYRLLRQYESKGTQHLVFRMFGIGGLNYHDYTLARVGDSIKASDVFVYTIDEELSENLSGLVNTMMLSYSKEKLPEESNILVRMTDEFKKKNYALVKEDYEKLDERYKGDKGIEVIYINSCHQLDPVLYQTALEHFVTRHPDAPSAYLMMIDLYYLRKENEKGLAAIDKMDKIIGGDPTLDVLGGISILYPEKTQRDAPVTSGCIIPTRLSPSTTGFSSWRMRRRVTRQRQRR